ncbi:MAG TPA: glycosyltransferase 87 family protein, partial [Saprospiraceae bacterium]|nr:glycosyltransferase 87 family protein [Saprospiraceae bacterium]
PYMAIFIIYFIIRRNRQAILYFLISSIAIAGITMLFFGLAPFKSYLFHSPTLRIPDWVYSEIVNQSLHAVLIRLGLITGGKSLMYIQVVAVIVLLSVFYLVYLVRRELYEFVIPFLLVIGLLLYPGTLMYYGVLMLFIIFQFFDQRTQLAINNVYLATGIVAIFAYLSAVSTFLAICFLLLVIVVISIIPMDELKFKDRPG